MNLLFDQETIMGNHEISLIRETERRVFVSTCQRFGQTLAETVRAFIDEFKVDEETAREDIVEYWKK